MPEVTADSIKQLFFAFIEEMDMSASYKPVLLLSFLDAANRQGRARIQDVVFRFRAFYQDRADKGLIVENPRMRMSRVSELTDAEVQAVIVAMPLRKFQQRRYLDYSRDVAWIQFDADLWKQLTAIDLDHIRLLCQQSVNRYYARLV